MMAMVVLRAGKVVEGEDAAGPPDYRADEDTRHDAAGDRRGRNAHGVIDGRG